MTRGAQISPLLSLVVDVCGLFLHFWSNKYLKILINQHRVFFLGKPEENEPEEDLQEEILHMCSDVANSFQKVDQLISAKWLR